VAPACYPVPPRKVRPVAIRQESGLASDYVWRLRKGETISYLCHGSNNHHYCLDSIKTGISFINPLKTKRICFI
jgi:hypothetical protein